jgi:hypothetical protein
MKLLILAGFSDLILSLDHPKICSLRVTFPLECGRVGALHHKIIIP